jgi:hypothetical protein
MSDRWLFITAAFALACLLGSGVSCLVAMNGAFAKCDAKHWEAHKEFCERLAKEL